MKKLLSTISTRLKYFLPAIQAYAAQSILLLIFILLASLYEIILNSNSNNSDLPLMYISFLILINSFLYWLKIFFLLLIPYLLIYFINRRLVNILYLLTATLLILLQLSLEQYFNKTFVPLGADLFAYSITDIKQTLSAAGGVSVGVIVYLVLTVALFVFVFIRFSKRINIFHFHSLILIAISCAVFFSSFTISSNSQKLKSEYAKTLVINKSGFFIEKTYQYFFPEILETDIYSDAYSGDFGNGTISIQDFAYVNEKEFPFLHKDETKDVLSPFFNQSASKHNIVILLVEGLGRAFTNSGAVLGNFTPFLDSLSNESLYWKNFLSSGGRSFAVLPSVLGSLPFAKNGFNELGEKMPHHLSLLSLARYNGYQTSFYYGGDSKFDNMGLFARKNAINNIYDESTFPAGYTKLPSKNGASWGYGDKEFFRRYIELQETRTEQPQLNVMFTVSTHSPFLINEQEKYNRIFDQRLNELKFTAETKAAYQEFKGQYASVLFFDDALRTFFENYKKRSDFSNTIFIITGDHRLPEIPMISKMDRYHVPLIIYSPLLKRKASFASVSSHFDIAPSLMAFLQNNYDFKKPSLATWIGSGLDTTRAFVNNHQYPLMQTKNEVIDFVQGEYHLNGESIFSLTPTMDEQPVLDKNKQQQLLGIFNQFKKRNEQFINGAPLIPDSIYQKYFPR